ncbi:MAG: peptidase [Desulfurococcaceae archaeon]
MLDIYNVLESCRRLSLAWITKDLIRKLSAYNRVQGSKGLEDAVKETASFLGGLGLAVKMFEVPSSSAKGFIETPASWDAVNGFVEFKKGSTPIARFNYVDHPTLIAAHSPPGEGCSKLKLCRDLHGCDGEAVLIEAPASVAYRELSSSLIVLYDSTRYQPGVPYTGVFLKSGEIKGTSVVNIPYSMALKLVSQLSKDVEVQVCWEVESAFSSRPMYGLIAYRGEDPGVLYTSHICHPKPGSHDNASGVVASILAAKMISSLGQGFSHAHLFIPEHTGTIYADSYMPWVPIAAINLDMVGSKQWITKSTLNIVIPPLFMRSSSAPYTYLASKLVLDSASSFGGFKLPAIKYSISPYTAGSDHDVTIAWGLDSTMLNEWPSKYYHTDLDDINTLSTPQIINIATVATLAGKMLAADHRKGQMRGAFLEYVKSWYSIEALKANVDISNVSRVLEEQVTPQFNPNLTPVSSRYLYRKLGWRKYRRLREIKGALAFLSVYAPLAYLSGVRDFFEYFQLENILRWSNEEKALIEEVWLNLRQELG